MKKMTTTAALAAMLTGAAFTAPQAHAQGLLQALGHATGLDQIGNQLGLNGRPEAILQPSSAQRWAAALAARGVPQENIQLGLDALARSLMSGQGSGENINGVLAATRVGPVQNGSCRSGGLGFKRATSRADFDVIGESGWCWQSGGWTAQPGQIRGVMTAAAQPQPSRPTRQMAQTPAPVQPKPVAVREVPAEARGVALATTLREGPEMTSPVLMRLMPRTVIRVTGEVPGTPWMRAEFDGRTGYVVSAYLSPVHAPAPQQEQAQAHPTTPSPIAPAQQQAKTEPTPASTPAPAPVQATAAAAPPSPPPAQAPAAPVPAPTVAQAPVRPVPTTPPVQQAQTAPQATPAPTQANATAEPQPSAPPAPPPKPKLKVDL